MTDLPHLRLGEPSDGPADMLHHLNLAIAAYAARNPHQAATSLHAAETAAKKANLHRQAAKIRKALTLLAQGGKPRLLIRPNYLEGPD